MSLCACVCVCVCVCVYVCEQACVYARVCVSNDEHYYTEAMLIVFQLVVQQDKLLLL